MTVKVMAKQLSGCFASLVFADNEGERAVTARSRRRQRGRILNIGRGIIIACVFAGPVAKINRAPPLPVAKILACQERPCRRATDGGHPCRVRPSVKRVVNKNRFHRKRVARLRRPAKRQAAALMPYERPPLRIRIEVPAPAVMRRIDRIAPRRRVREKQAFGKIEAPPHE
jgi:hypothetical protein